MKNLLFICLIAFAASCSSSQNMTVKIQPNDQVELTYPQNEMSMVDIKNKTLKTFDVAVLDGDDRDQVRGFGMGVMTTQSVMVEDDNILVLSNDSDQTIKVKVQAKNTAERPVQATNRDYVSFTLENTTPKSIPLLIPSVMNPNLSPFSKSGVDLKLGQEILFKEKGKKYVLLVVDETIQNGATLNVSQLLKEKKKELGI